MPTLRTRSFRTFCRVGDCASSPPRAAPPPPPPLSMHPVTVNMTARTVDVTAIALRLQPRRAAAAPAGVGLAPEFLVISSPAWEANLNYVEHDQTRRRGELRAPRD